MFWTGKCRLWATFLPEFFQFLFLAAENFDSQLFLFLWNKGDSERRQTGQYLNTRDYGINLYRRGSDWAVGGPSDPIKDITAPFPNSQQFSQTYSMKFMSFLPPINSPCTPVLRLGPMIFIAVQTQQYRIETLPFPYS